MAEVSVRSGRAPATGRGPLAAGGGPAFLIGLGVVVLALLSGFATYLILTGLTAIRPTSDVVVTVLLINAALVVAMLAVIGWQVVNLWRARRRQAAGSRLHVRIVALFAVIAAMPAIILAGFASISLDRGLDHWFSTRTKSIIQNSLGVAEAYVQEHGRVIRSEIVAMARDLDDVAKSIADEKTRRARLAQLLIAQAALRELPLAYLIDESGTVIAEAANPHKLAYLRPPPGALADARQGHAVVIAPGRSNRVGAIKKLKNVPGVYLYVTRLVDPKVIRHLRRTRAGVAEYAALEQHRTGLQIAFGLMYLVIALTLLLAAIWLGLWFANRLVAPIRRLIGAAEEVSRGNLEVRIPEAPGERDLGQLSTTFNHMTAELHNQREELLSANSELEERRRFIETVLSGVSSGVIGVDSAGRVTLVNPSAQELLGLDQEAMIGKRLMDIVPEFGKLLEAAFEPSHKGRIQDQVHFLVAGSERNFAVQVTREHAGDADYGAVVTFDDITELVTAQRTSAWADVARRIAHEIKNPLTPIQLSAERIRRKYGGTITEDRDIFERLTETIIRQVGDIKSMVDEFSSFARMPKAHMEPLDIREVVREAAFLFQVGHGEIAFDVTVPDEPVTVLFDRRLISQALTNLIKNASEAIAAVADSKDAPPGYKGRIAVRLSRHARQVVIEVVDNGCGLPRENRRRLVEPYMTTREKGTGLGLAIVHKITEQHGGCLELEDAPAENGAGGGALVRLTLPLREGAGETRHPSPPEGPASGGGGA